VLTSDKPLPGGRGQKLVHCQVDNGLRQNVQARVPAAKLSPVNRRIDTGLSCASHVTS
jgi:hypothetical protein